MGFFSWKTADTNKSIPNVHSGRKTFTVHMITKDGRVFTEEEYDGYGVFGGKDIYELVAELNNLCPNGDTDQKRSKAIDLLYLTIITDGKKIYTCGVDFRDWSAPIKGEIKSANELVDSGWERVYPNGYGDWNKAAKKGIILPKLVKKIPKDFDDIPYPTNCPAQGYFY